MNSGIYAILNLENKKFYIGQASNLKLRWWQHKNSLSKNKHHSSILQRAWNKYGEQNFVYLIVEKCDKLDLTKREQYYLDLWKPEYNICKIAESVLGVKRSEETKQKMSLASKSRIRSVSEIERLKTLRKGTKLTQEHKNKLKTYRHTKETKRKYSEQRIGNDHKRNYEKWPCKDGSKCKCERCSKINADYHTKYYKNYLRKK